MFEMCIHFNVADIRSSLAGWVWQNSPLETHQTWGSSRGTLMLAIPILWPGSIEHKDPQHFCCLLGVFKHWWRTPVNYGGLRCFFLHILINHQLYCANMFFEHQDGFATHFPCLKLSSCKGVKWWTYLTPTGFSVRKSQNAWKTRSDRWKKPILCKGTHAISKFWVPGLAQDQILVPPRIRSLPWGESLTRRLEHVELYQSKDGAMLEMTQLKKTRLLKSLSLKRAPNISYQDEPDSWIWNPQAVKSHSLFLTQKIIGNKLQTPKFVVTNINGLR